MASTMNFWPALVLSDSRGRHQQCSRDGEDGAHCAPPSGNNEKSNRQGSPRSLGGSVSVRSGMAGRYAVKQTGRRAAAAGCWLALRRGIGAFSTGLRNIAH
jgi:hypothetical protein